MPDINMAETDETDQVIDGVRCFDQSICGYYDEDRLSTFAFSSWHTLVGSSTAAATAEGDVSLDAKMKILKSNLTKFEKSLREGRVTDIGEFLKSNGLQHPLVHPQAVSAICSYLLYVVSCHSDPLLVNSAANTLSYHAESGAAFAPDRAQILAIALNMGMKKEFLPSFSPSELPGYIKDAGVTRPKPLNKYPDPFNVQQVVECLSELLRPGRYWTDDARDALFSVLVAMLLDPHMEHIMMTSRATSCLARLLQSYERTVWSRDMDTGKVLDLAEQLGRLPVEARLPVLAGLPPLGRGQQLLSLTGYLYLQHTIYEQHPNCTDTCGQTPFFDLPPSVTAGAVLQLVRGQQVGGLPPAVFLSSTADQLRSCYAVLRCVDAAVGSQPLPASQREPLRQLKEHLNSEIDRIRDITVTSATVIDETLEMRMHLKEFMTMLYSKWASMCR